MAAIAIATLHHVGTLASNPRLVGNQLLVDLLEFAAEQPIKGVIKLHLIPIPTHPSVSHACVRLSETS
jgi:hypothetical protein